MVFNSLMLVGNNEVCLWVHYLKGDRTLRDQMFYVSKNP